MQPVRVHNNSRDVSNVAPYAYIDEYPPGCFPPGTSIIFLGLERIEKRERAIVEVILVPRYLLGTYVVTIPSEWLSEVA